MYEPWQEMDKSVPIRTPHNHGAKLKRNESTPPRRQHQGPMTMWQWSARFEAAVSSWWRTGVPIGMTCSSLISMGKAQFGKGKSSVMWEPAKPQCIHWWRGAIAQEHGQSCDICLSGLSAPTTAIGGIAPASPKHGRSRVASQACFDPRNPRVWSPIDHCPE